MINIHKGWFLWISNVDVHYVLSEVENICNYTTVLSANNFVNFFKIFCF